MPSLFSRIIDGELPARFVYRDPDVVAFLTIAPLRPGHTLVVPVREVDHWLDLEPAELSRLMGVCRTVGAGIDRAFHPQKVALLLIGLEVPHVHVHLVPIESMADVDWSRVEQDPDPAALDAAAERLREELAG